MDYVELGSMLANKIQQLMIFFSLLIPDMTNEEEQLLDEALIKTYADYGITHDNESVYEDGTASPPKMKQMPILGDLHKHLLENKMTERNPNVCTHYYCSAAASEDRTEVYVVPKHDFPVWFVEEKAMPDKGVMLYENIICGA